MSSKRPIVNPDNQSLFARTGNNQSGDAEYYGYSTTTSQSSSGTTKSK